MPSRLRHVLAALEAEPFAALLREAAPEATAEQLTRVHPAAYVDAILAIRPAPGEHHPLDGDTLMSAGSAEAALRAAGGAVMAVDAVMEGWARAAFVATRPPGTHAERATAMGFCLFANAAIAARHARRAGAPNGSPWSISTSTTATAPRTSSRPTPPCSTPPATNIPATPAPAPRPSEASATSSTRPCPPAPAPPPSKPRGSGC